MVHYDPGGEAPPGYQIAELEDFYNLDGNGVPVMQQTQQWVEAYEPLRSIPCRVNAEVDRAEVVVGGRIGGMRDEDNGLYIADLVLDQPLRAGEQAYLAYNLHFNYADPPVPRYRRAVGSAVMDSLGIHVAFDSRKLPRRVTWAEWQGDTDDSLIVPGSEELTELVPLNDEPEPPLEVYRQVTGIHDKVVGFHWEW